MPIEPLAVSAYTMVNALGRGVDATVNALLSGSTGLRPCDFEDAELPTWIGRVDGLEEAPVNGALAAYDCRNNRLARLTLAQDDFEQAVIRARERYGPQRIGVRRPDVGRSRRRIATRYF